MLFRCLWEGRIGNDATVKVLLKRLYLLMDDTSDRGVFEQMRASGGTVEASDDFQFGSMAYTTPRS